jgi:hypothetical protein
MKRLIVSFAVVTMLVAICSAIVLRGPTAVAADTPATANGDKPVVKTLVFRAREPFPPQFLDIADPAGPSAGDEGIEKEFLWMHGKRIGYSLLHFTAVTVGRSGPDVIAEGVIILRNGQITLQGETTFRHIRVAVVGGTGMYQGVSGQLTVLRTLPGEVDVDRLRLVFPPH